MKHWKVITAGVLGLLLFPLLAWAVNITVPSAPGTGYILTSTTTGAYVYVAGSGVSGNCVKWGANNSLLDVGSPCSSGSGSGNVSTSTHESAGELAYWTSNSATPALLGEEATSTLNPASPLTGSFIQLGAAGSLGIQAASGSQNGYLSSADYSLLHTATTTFGGGLSYSNSTNQATFTGLESTSTNPFMATYFVATSTTQASNFPYASSTAITASGTMFANNFYDTSLSGNTCVSESSSLIVGSTYCVTSVSATWPLASSGGTNPVISSATSSGSSAGLLSAADWTTFNNKQPALSLLAGTYTNGDVCTYASSGTLLNCNTTPTTGTVTSVGLSSTNSTLIIGSTPVTTSGTITADLNLNHSNWFTATQNFTQASTSAFTATSSDVFFTGLTAGTGNGALCLSSAGLVEYSSGANCVAGSSASSTLLTDNNTFSGATTLASSSVGTLAPAPMSLLFATSTYGYTSGGNWYAYASTSINQGNATNEQAWGIDAGIREAYTACFTAGTKVVTLFGEENIEDIKVGDIVMSYNLQTESFQAETVTQTFVHQVSLYITLVDSDGNSFNVTPVHPIYTTDRGWVEAGNLRIGEQVMNVENGSMQDATILSLKQTILTSVVPVYDLEVDGNHDYFANGILVHNKPGVYAVQGEAYTDNGTAVGGTFGGQVTGSGKAYGLLVDHGNTGLGTLTPQFLLEVNGTASTTKLFATNASTTNLTAASFADSALTSGDCVQATTGGYLLSAAAACGTGTVTSVTGTANQITSSGGTAPVLSLPNLVIFPSAASSTIFSNFQNAYFGATATSSFNSAGTLTLQDPDNPWSGISTPTHGFILMASSTFYVAGTSSVPATPAYYAGTVKNVRCFASSTAAFLGVTPYIGTTAMTPSYFVASNTVGTITFTGNNTFTVGQVVGMNVGTGTAASADQSVSCTFSAIQTS